MLIIDVDNACLMINSSVVASSPTPPPGSDRATLGARGLCCTDGHFFAKFDRFTSQFLACGAQKLDLAYVYVVSVAGSGYVVDTYGCSAQSAVALNTNLGHGSTREAATIQCCISEALVFGKDSVPYGTRMCTLCSACICASACRKRVIANAYTLKV